MTRTTPHPLSVSLVTLGDPNTLTGGYLYHRRLAELASRYGARLVFASFPAWPFPFPLLHAPRLPRVLTAQGADVVVLDSIAAAFLAPRMTKVRAPVVAMLHQPPGGIDHGPVRRHAQAVLDRAAYRHVERVVVASQLLADQLGAQGFAAKLLVVPPGRDVAPAAGGPKRDLRAGCQGRAAVRRQLGGPQGHPPGARRCRPAAGRAGAAPPRRRRPARSGIRYPGSPSAGPRRPGRPGPVPRPPQPGGGGSDVPRRGRVPAAQPPRAVRHRLR